MLARLLCPVSGAPGDRRGLDAAATIATAFASHVEVLHARPDPAAFVPYLGFGTGLVLALLAAAIQEHAVRNLVVVGIVFGFGQLLESFFLTPRIVGQRIGLHPVAVVFALLAFGHVFGFFGVLLALPASAVLLVGLRHLKDAYFASAFYREG